ncbi:MAG: hypothetical protein AAB458_00670 [Patescibacteria group bacterium]
MNQKRGGAMPIIPGRSSLFLPRSDGANGIILLYKEVTEDKGTSFRLKATPRLFTKFEAQFILEVLWAIQMLSVADGILVQQEIIRSQLKPDGISPHLLTEPLRLSDVVFEEEEDWGVSGSLYQ